MPAAAKTATADTKRTILEAAASIVQREGARHLTIDAVAAEAGLSKGGVLYHFPNKRAMLEGMLHTLMTSIEAQPTGTSVRSLMRRELNQSPQEQAMSRAILAAASEDPQLLDPARGLFEAVMQDIRDSDDSADAQTIVFLALQGLFFLDMMNLSPLSQAEAKQAHVTMEKMLNGAAS